MRAKRYQAYDSLGYDSYAPERVHCVCRGVGTGPKRGYRMEIIHKDIILGIFTP